MDKTKSSNLSTTGRWDGLSKRPAEGSFGLDFFVYFLDPSKKVNAPPAQGETNNAFHNFHG